MTNTLKSRGECIYYLVREMGGLGPQAKGIYFDEMLKHIRQKGLKGMSNLEIDALIMAAQQRGRMDELDAAVKAVRRYT